VKDDDDNMTLYKANLRRVRTRIKCMVNINGNRASSSKAT